MKKVLITGITGFLGAHVAENLINNNIHVIGLKRQNSNIWRCENFKDKIQWIDIDEEGVFENNLINISYDVVVHSAWIGVEAIDRDQWNNQINNIPFLLRLLEFSKNAGVKKFIFFGSQAEYGYIDGVISENSIAEPLSAYGSVKLACVEILKTFCTLNSINWISLRLFPLFGEKEGDNWLIPSLIKKMLMEDKMDFTLGEQKYAYLYVKDFAEIVNKIIYLNINSGIYNVSSNNPKPIRILIESIRNLINTNFNLNFGNLEYRSNQSMHLEGDMTKLYSQIGKLDLTKFDDALKNTIKYYLK